jgi:hypothetical protein
MTAADFIQNFRYNLGIILLDGYKRIDSEPYEGDCNDFGLTVLLLLEGGWWGAIKAMLTFRAALWLVWSPQNGMFPRHLALYHRDYGWIDSTNRQWRDDPGPHKRCIPMILPWVMFMGLVGKISPFK